MTYQPVILITIIPWKAYCWRYKFNFKCYSIGYAYHDITWENNWAYARGAVFSFDCHATCSKKRHRVIYDFTNLNSRASSNLLILNTNLISNGKTRFIINVNSVFWYIMHFAFLFKQFCIRQYGYLKGRIDFRLEWIC